MVLSRYTIFGSVVARRLTIASVATLALLCSRSVNAAPIVYTYTGTATGTFDATAFTAANYTITLTSDTTLVMPEGEGAQALGPATVSIAGIGTGTFTDAMGAFDNTSFAEVLFSDFTQDLEFVAVPASVFSSYGLTTSIGPIAGSGTLLGNAGTTYPTTLGDVSFTDVQSATFTATTSGVPEPATTGLLLSAVSAAVLRRRQAGKRRGN